MSHSFVIGTGYFKNSKAPVDDFPTFWHRNLMRSLGCGPGTNIDCPSIFVANHDGGNDDFKRILRSQDYNVKHITEIPVSNLGHIHQLLKLEKPYKDHELCGWSASVMMLALIAYNCEKDFVYVEEDCLLFGPIIQNIFSMMLRDDLEMMFGSNSFMSSAQALFVVKHSFIPNFVCRYLMLWPDSKARLKRTEDKFTAMESTSSKMGRFPYGVDRDRPLPVDEKIWYAQQITELELDHLKRLKLV